MTAVTAPAKVLVTGANGYVAAWVVRALLEAGYDVRGTVRSKSKAAYLETTFKQSGDKFDVVVVEDITQERAFDEAVKGVDAIEHTASPFHWEVKHPDEMIKPAVRGTLGVLESALKHAPNVKRIVITASTASLLGPPPPGTYNERDWNDASIAEVERDGAKASAVAIYCASKTLAEKAAWKFVEDHKAELNWDLVVLNPPWVLGPTIHEVASPSSLNTSMNDWFHRVLRSSTQGQLMFSGGWIDVRDLGEAHIKAIRIPEAGGERFLVSAELFVWQDWVDVANSLDPPPLGNYELPKGTPGAGKGFAHPIVYDTSKAARLLGMTYRTKEECARDCLLDFARRGWVNYK